MPKLVGRLVRRSKNHPSRAEVAQLVEQCFRKAKVASSNLAFGSGGMINITKAGQCFCKANPPAGGQACLPVGRGREFESRLWLTIYMNAIKFEKFLGGIILVDYRKKYSPVKILEMDMPRNTQALNTLYRVYWDERKLLSFEDFYKEYLSDHRKALKDFYKKTLMCSTCFQRGLEARIYRTWASIITQIHAGYVAREVFISGEVLMSENLDHQGVDFQVRYHNKILNYDVKKIAKSGVTGRERKPKKSLAGRFVQIRYEVPNFEIIRNPEKKNGKGFKKAYLVFKEKYLDTHRLRSLSNGFIVFTPFYFEKEKKKIDSLK